MTDRPRLICIPSSDTEFGEYVAGLYDELPRGLDLDALVDELTRRLHVRYPAAVVRPREAIAAVLPDDDVLYVSNRSANWRLAASVEVPVPVDEAFRTYVDRIDEWLTALDVQPVALEAGLVGSVYAVRYDLFGRSVPGRLRIAAADPPRWVRFDGHGGGIDAWYITSFEETEGGTKVHVAGDYDIPDDLVEPSIGRVAAERAVSSQIEASHEALRVLCESGSLPTPTAPHASRGRRHIA